jgi:hypothetical protein
LISDVSRSFWYLFTHGHFIKVLSWYLTSIKSKDKELASKDDKIAMLIESKNNKIALKDKELATLKDTTDKELATLKDTMDKELATLKDTKINEIGLLTANFTALIKEKEDLIAHLSEEKKDVMTTLKDVVRRDIVMDQKWS